MIEEVPKSFVYRCDAVACDKTHIQKNANGHYTESTPANWATFRVVLPDDHSTASRTLLLCPAHKQDLVMPLMKACGHARN